MELKGNQVWNGEDEVRCDDHLAKRSFGTAGRFLSPTSVAKMDDRSRALQAWENLEQRHRGRKETSYPRTCDLLVSSPCVFTDLEKKLTAQQHLFPDYAQTRAHICDSHEQPHPWSCSNDDGRFE